jgi:hypothetical protein
MCCFSRPVRHVSETQIFARSAPGGGQFLVYSMNVSLAEDLAMCLPLPTPPGAPEDAVHFLDLSGYRAFFGDMARGFPAHYLAARKGGFFQQDQSSERRLKVHAAGEFEASFVPTLRDFERLDPRFRLPSDVWDHLPRYHDYGFAVFKLRRPGLFGWLRRMRTIHPMAMEFPRRDPQSLFFPTVHVHDGQVHAEAHFDHSLYCQPDPGVEALLDWERSELPLSRWMEADRAAGIVNGGAHAYRRLLHGTAKNRDVVLDEAAMKAATALGELFLLRVREVGGDIEVDARGDWPELAPAERERIQQDLARRLVELTRARREEWRLARYRSDLPDRWPTLYEAIPEAGGAPSSEPCRIKFFVWTQRVAPMEISLAFSDVPARELREVINAELQQILDDASEPPAGAAAHD